jgi:hypothetical protein
MERMQLGKLHVSQGLQKLNCKTGFKGAQHDQALTGKMQNILRQTGSGFAQ